MEFYVKNRQISHFKDRWFLPVTTASAIDVFPDGLIPKGANGMLIGTIRKPAEMTALVYLLNPVKELANPDYEHVLHVWIDEDMPVADIAAQLIYPNGDSLAKWLRDYYVNIAAHALNFVQPQYRNRVRRFSQFLEFCRPERSNFLRGMINHPSIPAPIDGAQRMDIFAESLRANSAQQTFEQYPEWRHVPSNKVVRALSREDVKLWVGLSETTPNSDIQFLG